MVHLDLQLLARPPYNKKVLQSLQLCRSLGKGLGCVLIKSTLGPGENPEGVEDGRGGMHGDNGGQKGTVHKQPEKREDDSCHSWRAPSKWNWG
jgi:hypothetical protein